MTTELARAATDATDDVAGRFRRDGYLVVPDAFSPAELDELRHEGVALCRGERGRVPGMPLAVDAEPDEEVISRVLCIHHPHKSSELIARTLAHPAIVDVLTRVVGPDVKAMQSMYFVKASGKPGQAWHQDENFIATRDRSLTAAWIALDDATTENGCLWVIPGSHAPGILWPTRETTDEQWDCTDEAVGFPYADADAVPVEVKAGTIVFFNGYLLHRSLPNRATSGFRRALVNHYLSAQSLLPNGLEFAYERADNRDIVMVAGTDPYAWKGTETKVKTHIRPERKGGCVWLYEEEGLPADTGGDDD